VERIDSVHARHAQVEEQDIGSHGPQHCDRLLAA
jgi:hypothetical protein